jgi:YfiH family protein
MNALLNPDWPAAAPVRALVTTRAAGDMSGAEARERLALALPREPAWLKQVHGKVVVDAESAPYRPQADACVSRKPGTVCAVMIADCMPVLFADQSGRTVAAAHAGWRGLAAGVLEATVDAMRVPPREIIAWLGPAIGPRAYEVGDEVREAFVSRDAAASAAFQAARPGHWLLDLYLVARQRLAGRGLQQVHGGGFCTYTETDRFFSFRRDGTGHRMAALIWLT